MFYTNIFFYILVVALLLIIIIFTHDAFSDKVIARKESAIMIQNCFAIISIILLVVIFFVFGWKVGLLVLGISVIMALIVGFAAQKKRHANIVKSIKKDK